MKRSVAHDLPDWPGWEAFNAMLEGGGHVPHLADSKKYATTIFETGCRLNEVILLKPNMFKINEEAIVCRNAPLLKKGRRATREVMIRLDDKDPLAYSLVEYIEACETEYLLPGLTPFTRAVEGWRHVSPKTVYNRVTELHPELWPQALRGYRASMLVYERDFNVQDLVSWFDWSGADMALHYTKTRDLASMMGIKNVPR